MRSETRQILAREMEAMDDAKVKARVQELMPAIKRAVEQTLGWQINQRDHYSSDPLRNIYEHRTYEQEMNDNPELRVAVQEAEDDHSEALGRAITEGRFEIKP